MILSQRSRTVTALGVVMIFTWGTTYYLLSVLATTIQADTGWRLSLVMAGVSVGLLASGLAARRVGRLIQARGGRQVLAGGMLLIATGLALMAVSNGPVLYLLAWLVTGLGMAAGLYEAAFSSLVKVYGANARSAITALTLWGGFASTVCWPLSAMLVQTVGWRGTCLTYAVLHLCVSLPLCRYALPRLPPEPPATDSPAPVVPVRLTDLRIWCIGCSGVLMSVSATILLVHLLPLLAVHGVGLVGGIALGALIGPSQVAARVAEMLGRGRHHPVWTMTVATTLFAIGFAGLALGLTPAVALVAYGAGNGLWSIARGALPLALFGPRDYPRIMGLLATPMLLGSAAAPVLGALLVTRLGAQATLNLLAVVAMVPCLLALVLLARILRERRTAPVL